MPKYLNLPQPVYIIFEELLLRVIREIVDDSGKKLSLTKLWGKFAKTELGNKWLNGRASYMKRKLENKKVTDTIPIDTEQLVDFMELIHKWKPDSLPAPKEKFAKGLMFSRQAEAWGKCFLTEYFAEQPELIKHFQLHYDDGDSGHEQRNSAIVNKTITSDVINLKIQESQKDYKERLFKKVSPEDKLLLLDQTNFTIEYMQGDMQDYAVVSLWVKAPNVVYGVYRILYQQKGGSYPYAPEILSMQGLLLGSDIIVLNLVNNNKMRTHVCTMQLFCDSNFNLSGHYIVDYREGIKRGIPEERRDVKTGEILYSRATPEDATAYLEKMMEGKKRKNELYNYRGNDITN